MSFWEAASRLYPGRSQRAKKIAELGGEAKVSAVDKTCFPPAVVGTVAYVDEKGRHEYVVFAGPEGVYCSCPDASIRNAVCKHLIFFLGKLVEQGVLPEPVAITLITR